jgi:outer membrane receptor protein involved in Fe transport
MVLNTYEDIHSLQGRPPENLDYADQQYYPEVFYHDVRFAYDIFDNVQAYAGVDNVTNQLPPLGLTGTGAGSGIYDIRGRFYYLGVKAKVH